MYFNVNAGDESESRAKQRIELANEFCKKRQL